MHRTFEKPQLRARNRIFEYDRSALPERCHGLALCLTGDVLGASLPNWFLPHPEREPDEDLTDYLTSVGFVL